MFFRALFVIAIFRLVSAGNEGPFSEQTKISRELLRSHFSQEDMKALAVSLCQETGGDKSGMISDSELYIINFADSKNFHELVVSTLNKRYWELQNSPPSDTALPVNGGRSGSHGLYPTLEGV